MLERMVNLKFKKKGDWGDKPSKHDYKLVSPISTKNEMLQEFWQSLKKH